MLESNLLITPTIVDHPQAIHDPNTGFIHPLIHMYPWKSTKKYLSFQHFVFTREISEFEIQIKNSLPP